MIRSLREHRFFRIAAAAVMLACGQARAADNEPVITDDSSSRQEEQIRTLTGQVEELTYRLRESEKKVDRLNKDYDLRFRDLEKNPDAAHKDSGADAPRRIKGDPLPLGSRDSAAKDDAASADEAPVKKKPTAGGHYAAGLEAFKAKDYTSAESELKSALKEKPGKQTGNALYWLGETYYAQKNYKSAAGSFLDSYKRYPDGNKSGPSLYKLGLSLFALDRGTEGCKIMREVRSRYANEGDLKAQAGSAMSRHNCN